MSTIANYNPLPWPQSYPPPYTDFDSRIVVPEFYNKENMWMPAKEGCQPSAAPRTSRFLMAIAILGSTATFLLVLAAFPLIILVTPKPELANTFPGDLKCATCAEINAHNPQMLEVTTRGQRIDCRGLGSTEEEKKDRTIYKAAVRCWHPEITEEGMELDEWLRPQGWTRAMVVEWMKAKGLEV